MAGFLNTWIDNVTLSGNNLQVKGWIVHSIECIMSISVFSRDTQLVSHLEVFPRPDIEVTFPTFPYALYSSFNFLAPCPPELRDASYYPFQLYAYLSNGETQTIGAAFVDIQREISHFPVPPSNLMARVRGFETGWLEAGARIYSSMKTAVEKHRQLAECGRILDWGCGSGNVLRYLTYDIPSRRIYGCDIDYESISWDTQNINGPTFRANGYLPPLSFADEYFDLIYGISVFTHLNEEMQFKWLQELRRLIAPGGMLVVSVHAQSTMSDQIVETITKTDGFFDLESPQQAEYAAFSVENYYRMTYHTKDYILREWSKYFKIVDYIEKAIDSVEDLVLMACE